MLKENGSNGIGKKSVHLPDDEPWKGAVMELTGGVDWV